MGYRREDRQRIGEGRCDEGKRQWHSWWNVVGGGGRRDDDGGEEYGGRDGSRKGIGAGGSAYKSDGGDPYWKRMKWKIETDLG